MLDPTGPIARRFPLVARPRPACTPLPQRVADLGHRAAAAAHHRDTAAATAVFNLAALLAPASGRTDWPAPHFATTRRTLSRQSTASSPS
jgi:hypothetical protein